MMPGAGLSIGRVFVVWIAPLPSTGCPSALTDQFFTHRNGNDTSGAFDGAAFMQARIAAQNDDRNEVLLQILRHAELAVIKLNQLIGHTVIQTAGAGNAVADEDNCARLTGFELALVVFNLFANDLCDLFGSQFHTAPAFSHQSMVFLSMLLTASRRWMIVSSTRLPS